MITKLIANNKLVSITGPAGSGKTTMAHTLNNVAIYSTDYSFIGDSLYRKELLEYKSISFDAYIGAVNQMNWWNWDKIYTDIFTLLKGNTINIHAYDRDTSLYKNIDIIPADTILVEGAILNYHICDLSDLIIYKYSDDKTRFFRLLEKDNTRRNFHEIIARWLITSYSENIANKIMFDKFSDKIITIDDNYDIIPDFEYNTNITYIPFPI